MEKNMLNIGDTAPDFSVLSDEEKTVTLSEFKGKPVVLYFYPKDDTPGCTIESCDFRDSLSRLENHGVVVLGISRDDVKSHKKFKEKYNLNFPLLADTDENICTLYNVIVEKNMYGKKVRGVDRSTFLIDAQGKITHIWRSVKVEGHVDEILSTLN
jgi:peroxiredoxin Q/BCP